MIGIWLEKTLRYFATLSGAAAGVKYFELQLGCARCFRGQE